MYLRIATAAFAVLAIGLPAQSDRAAAQGYPYVRDRGMAPPPSPYMGAPENDDEEESVVMVPEARSGLPYPPRADRYIPSAPGFIYPDRDPNAPPNGNMQPSDIQRGELPPPGIANGGDYAPRPPGGINSNQQQAYPGNQQAYPGMQPYPGQASPGQQTYPGQQQPVVSSLPPDDQPETGEPKELPPQFRRQLVDFRTKEPAGTLVIDTANTYLYLVMGNGQALRYGIGVGRDGFTWAGTERVSRMAEWPDWHPPEEMISRQPYLPRFMAGGEGNPLGARALYLGNTLYRIHGTNQPSTIGTFVSSGCVRLTNEDIQDLYQRVKTGTRVVVLPGKPPVTAQNQAAGRQQGLPPATAEAQVQPPQVVRAR